MAFILDATLKLKFKGITEFQNRLAAAIKNATTTANATGVISLNKQLDKTVTSAGNSATAVAKASKAQGELSKASDKASKSVSGASKNLADGTKQAKSFGEGVALAGTRYLRFVAATAIPLAGIAALGLATKATLEFEQQLLKLDQVLNPTRERFDELRTVILDLSSETGVAAGEIAEAARILAQAGALTEGVDLRGALEDLARVPLLPTFAGIEQATEGILAFSNQFGLSIDQTGEILEKLNAVSKQFAVESSDLIEAAKRGGAAFKAFGGDIDEFIAIVTVLRQTTRESASSIGTALKTISARIIRPKNIAELQAFGIATKNVNGELLTSIDILRNVAARFGSLNTAQQRQLAETLGGFRQVGKVVAALGDNFELFDKALNVSRNSAGTLASDTNKALATVGGQLGILKAELNEFIQQLAGPVILPILQNLTSLARAITGIGTAFGPAIAAAGTFATVLTGIIALKATPALVGFVGNLVGGLTGGSAATVAAGAGGGVGAAAAGAAGAAGAARGGAAAALRSGAGQLVILGVLNAAFGQLVDSSTSLNDEQKQLLNRIAILGSSFIALNAIISKQTITQSLSSLGGALTAAASVAVIGAAVAVNAVGQQSIKETTEAIEGISNKFSNSLKSIDTAGAADIVEQAVFALNQSVAEATKEAEAIGLKEIVGEFVGRFSNAFKSFGEGEFIQGIKNLFSDAFPKDKITSEITQGLFDNTEIFTAAVAEAVRTGGVNFQKRLRETIGQGLPEAEANKKIEDAFKAIGGLVKTLDTAKLNEAKGRLEQTVNDLAVSTPDKLFPDSLLTDIQTFSDAFGEAVRSIQEGNKTFDRLIGKRVTDFEKEIAPKVDREDVIGDLLEGSTDKLGDQLADLPKPVIEGIRTGLSNANEATALVKQLQASIAQSGKETLDATNLLTTLLGDAKPNEAVTKVLTSLKNAILQAVQEGRPLSEAAIRELVTKNLPFAVAAEAFIEQLIAVENAVRGQVNRRNQALNELEENAGRNLPAPLLIKRLQQLSEATGIDFPISNIQGFTDAISENKNALENVRNITDSYSSSASQITEKIQETQKALDALRQRRKDNLIGEDDFLKQVQELGAANRVVVAQLRAFNDVLRLAPQAIDAEAKARKEDLKARLKGKESQEELNRGLEAIEKDRQNSLLTLKNDIADFNKALGEIRIQRAIETSNIFKPLTDAGGIIKLAVENFDKSVDRLLAQNQRQTGGGVELTVAPLSDAQRTLAIEVGLLGKSFAEVRKEFEAEKELIRSRNVSVGSAGGGVGLALPPSEESINQGAIANLARRFAENLGDPSLFVPIRNQLTLALKDSAFSFAEFLQQSAQGIQRERIERQLTAGGAQNEGRAREVSEARQPIADFIGNTLEKLGGIVGDLKSFAETQGQQQEETTETTAANTEELDGLMQATDKNTKATEKATDDQGAQSTALGESLDKTTVAIVDLKNGVDVQLSATQDLSVKVSLDESLTKFQPQLELVMKNIAQDEMRQAVEGLLSNTTDPDRQKEINDTLEGFA